MAMHDHTKGRRTARQAGELDTIIETALLESKRPLSAYDIQKAAAASGEVLYPAQIYRALKALLAKERIVRIEMLNAYLPKLRQGCVLMICAHCEAIEFADLPAIRDQLLEGIHRSGFHPQKLVIETLGLCSLCSAGSLNPSEFDL